MMKMKLSSSPLVLGVLVAVATISNSVSATTSLFPNNNVVNKWTPTRITFDQLQRLAVVDDNDDDDFAATTDTDPSSSSINKKKKKISSLLWNAFKENGIISITDIPNFPKSTVIQQFEDCLKEEEEESSNTPLMVSKSTIFEDGTKRQTIATRSIDGGRKMESLFPPSTTADQHLDDEDGDSSSCYDMLKSSDSFRSGVQQVIDAIATWIGKHHSSVETSSSLLLLQDAYDTTKTYNLENTIKDGEHLEHFHAYHYPPTTSTTNDEASSENLQNTIDWHTDQGIMIAFTPGVVGRNQQTTNGFYVKLPSQDDDEVVVEMEFDPTVDDLVIMLGDGVYQYINHYLDPQEQLHSVQHALKLNANNNHNDDDDNHPRVWYGRMVLPPPTAYHPSSSSSKKMTIEEMRLAMIENDPEALMLGCSKSASSSSTTTTTTNNHHQMMIARELSGEELCNSETQQYCWHRCMNYTDYLDATPTVCQNQNLSTACVNDEGFLWTDKHDPDFYLGCIDLATAENVTYPSEDGDGSHGGSEDDNGDKQVDCSTVNVTDLASCAAWCGDNYTATFEPEAEHGHDNSGLHMAVLVGFSCECEEEGPTSTTRLGEGNSHNDGKSCLLPYDLPTCSEHGLGACGEEGDGSTKTCSELCTSVGIGLPDDDSDDMCHHVEVEDDDHGHDRDRWLSEEDGHHEDMSYTMCFCKATGLGDGYMVCGDDGWEDKDDEHGDSHDDGDESSSPPMHQTSSLSLMMTLTFLVAIMASSYFQ